MIGNSTHGRYISFSNTPPDDKLGCLYLNEMNNIEGWFKTLQNVNADDNSMMDKE